MAKYIGRLVDLGIGRETTRGTGVAPTYAVPKVDFSFDDKVTKSRSVAGVGQISDSEEAFVTTKYGEGDIEGEIRSDSFGLLLYALLGTLTTTGPTDSSYSHAFSLANTNTHTSLSFLVKDSNTTELYKLCMLNELEIEAALDEIVKFTASFMGKQAVGSGATMPSYADEYKFTKKHLRIKIAANLAALDAASAISVKNLMLTISKNVVLDDVLGTAEPEDILNRQISVEGEIQLNYEDETYKNYMKNNTFRAMEIAFINTDETIGASTNPSLTLRFPYVDFFDWEPDNALDEIVSQTISFKANRDVSGGNQLISTCTLVNTVVSY